MAPETDDRQTIRLYEFHRITKNGSDVLGPAGTPNYLKINSSNARHIRATSIDAETVEDGAGKVSETT